MLARLTLLIILVTSAELSILIPLWHAVGLPMTLAIVVITAFVGAALAKRQGITIWNRIQQELRKGQMPGDSLLDGLAVLVAGAFLLTPGVLTDLSGILLLIPPCRKPLKKLVKKYSKKMLEQPDVTHHVEYTTFEDVYSAQAGRPGARATSQSEEEDIIDVEPVERDSGSDDERVEPIGELSTTTE